jgi:hypothetical protein
MHHILDNKFHFLTTYDTNPTFCFNDLQVDPLSTISAIRPNVIHGHQQVKQPERKHMLSYKWE